jgi:hypothetical protein
MPIRPDLRPFYHGPAWQAVRQRILTRAGGCFDDLGKYRGGAKCEQCGRVDRRRYWVLSMRTVNFDMLLVDQYFSLVKGDGQLWRSCVSGGQRTPLRLRGEQWKLVRRVKLQIGVAHVNGVAGDDRDENLRAWCQWCHLRHDQAQHKQTRSARKDAARPLLQEK